MFRSCSAGELQHGCQCTLQNLTASCLMTGESDVARGALLEASGYAADPQGACSAMGCVRYTPNAGWVPGLLSCIFTVPLVQILGMLFVWLRRPFILAIEGMDRPKPKTPSVTNARNGRLVGLFVGALVGVLVGFLVSTLVGAKVGALVGALVGFLVSTLVGKAVGRAACCRKRVVAAYEPEDAVEQMKPTIEHLSPDDLARKRLGFVNTGGRWHKRPIGKSHGWNSASCAFYSRLSQVACFVFLCVPGEFPEKLEIVTGWKAQLPFVYSAVLGLACVVLSNRNCTSPNSRVCTSKSTLIHTAVI